MLRWGEEGAEDQEIRKGKVGKRERGEGGGRRDGEGRTEGKREVQRRKC